MHIHYTLVLCALLFLCAQSSQIFRLSPCQYNSYPTGPTRINRKLLKRFDRPWQQNEEQEQTAEISSAERFAASIGMSHFLLSFLIQPINWNDVFHHLQQLIHEENLSLLGYPSIEDLLSFLHELLRHERSTMDSSYHPPLSSMENELEMMFFLLDRLTRRSLPSSSNSLSI